MTGLEFAANSLGLAGSGCLLYSTFKKEKSGVIGVQICDSVFCCIGNLLIGGLAGAFTNLLATIRNVLNYKSKMTMPVSIVLCLILIIFGAANNREGCVGWLPIIASSSYTMAMLCTKNATALKVALLANILLWASYSIIIGMYFQLAIYLITIVITTLNIVKE